jgi:predicted porin
MKRLAFQSCAIAGAIASLVAASVAHAETNVTIYGVADVYVAFQKGDKSETKVDSGGLSGSRLGFSASQDIGNGLKAIGKFEAGVAADTGKSTQSHQGTGTVTGGTADTTVTRTWGRQTWVGLSGNFGTVTAGRQYTPTFVAIDNDDPFETGAGSAASSGIISIVGGSRADNSIAWELPKFGDVTANLMYAAGESSSGSNQNNSFIGAGLRYSAGPLGLGLTIGHQNRADDAGVAATSVLLAGTYDFGAASIHAGVQSVHNSTRAANVDDNRTEFFAGVHVPFGDDKLWAGFGTGKTNKVDGSRASQASLGYLHSLYKNTTLYGVVTSIHNGSATSYTTDTATGDGPAVSAGKNASALQVGIRYKF